MKSIRFRFLVAAMAVMLGAAISQAQTADTTAPPPPPGGHHFGMFGPMMGLPLKELNLTDDQKTQVKSVMQKEHANMKPLMQQFHQLEQQLKQYSEGTYDQPKVQALITQQSQTLVNLMVEMTKVHNEIYQVLTSDQQAQLKQIEAQHQQRMQQHEQGATAPPTEE
jgi:Spy/CpxP family protein refolding chaperone